VTNTSNRQAIADLYDSFLSGDPAPALAAFSDRSVWIEPGDNARSGIYRGPQEIAEHTVKCREMTDGTWGTDVLEIVGGDRFVIVVERALALRNGTALNMICNTVYEMTNGVVCEMRVLPYDGDAWNEFWS
jgi:ketosteroid isomerase-like protein